MQFSYIKYSCYTIIITKRNILGIFAYQQKAIMPENTGAPTIYKYLQYILTRRADA
jgi:hypothetical protein